MHAALTDPPFKGLVLTSENSPIWNGLYPLIPNEVNFVALFLYFIIGIQLLVRLSTLFSPSPTFLCGYFGGNNQKLHRVDKSNPYKQLSSIYVVSYDGFCARTDLEDVY